MMSYDFVGVASESQSVSSDKVDLLPQRPKISDLRVVVNTTCLTLQNNPANHQQHKFFQD
jgi:hypothetical protein